MRSEQAAIAANRFGLGARRGDADAIGADPAGWLVAQLAAPDVDLPGPRTAETLRRVGELELARRVQARANASSREPAPVDRTMLRDYAQFIGAQYREQASARCQRAMTTDRPFLERLVHFWSNHFAVSTDKQPLGAIAGCFENEAIRPHVTGSFRAMLRAVEQHPAMILYLDNQASIGPGSAAARAVRRNRDREPGLNENLAREILELHTLGVDGGYAQTDVTELARVLTGWSIGAASGPLRGGEPGEFHFRPLVHEPGAKTILGRRVGEDGLAEGEAVLAWLARQPATARHIATKLAQHFVADAPPAGLIERLARTFLDAEGELLPVYRALVGARESWARPLAKYKTPHDFVISAYRAFEGFPGRRRQLPMLLAQLGQPLWRPGSPAGWPDLATHWDGGDALLKRVEWAAALGRATGDRLEPIELGEQLLGPVLGEHTRASVGRAESAGQGLALLLAAPEFQRR